ncbi:MAG: pyridoxal phosphate-dependent aminotransferase [Deltaproteobacteria bacterium]|jgi:aspartate aminotransferase|nr:pyridoxal phosphate-dependent aminotransferase [Deltaproteobacteria bacterium]MCL5879900.1 pyridoxal phosphate-dependent aminotransferase [Deltaproteobacteria bacterium]MDA8303822.1 pyridoxal phosphate-dependent aminotransferase [Deltaproteobacteria bacterium]
MKLSCRASLIKPSATLAITAKAKKLKAEGKNIIGFGAGEPDFDTPGYIKDAVKDALDKGYTKYTPVSGIDELKSAIADKFLSDYNVRYEQGEIIVSCGGKHSLYNLFSALLNEGDEIIVPSPYWVSYTEIIKLSGGVPVVVDTSGNGFKFNLRMLESNLTKKTRGLIINSPSNPTGVLMDEKDIIEIANFVKKHDLYIITDDIYEKIIFDDKKFFNALMAGKSMKENTIAVNAVSKTYSMTGFRIGYTAGPKDLISAMNNIQSQSTSNPTTFAQYGALAALKGGYDFTVMMRNEFQKRRDYMMDFFGKNIKSITPVKPDGAFYIFADISKVFDESGNKINSSTEFCDYLLDKYLVAAVPGIEFGNDNFIRLSFATSLDVIKEGLNRIKEAVSF